MRHFVFALTMIAPIAAASAQSSATTQPAATPRLDQLPRHLVMITRAGPNFSKLGEHRTEAREHQALWKRLDTEGHTLAGGAFEGQPVMGMTIFKAGVTEMQARELIKNDPFPRLGITQYEFRTFIVVNGVLKDE